MTSSNKIQFVFSVSSCASELSKLKTEKRYLLIFNVLTKTKTEQHTLYTFSSYIFLTAKELEGMSILGRFDGGFTDQKKMNVERKYCA